MATERMAMNTRAERYAHPTYDRYLSQRRHHCLTRFFNLYTAWGYHFVHLPLTDSYQHYDRPHNQELLEASYRFVDSNGELLLLRPDMTLFLLRHIAQIDDTHYPYRLWYADSVVRRLHREDTSLEDLFQSGAEFIGASQSLEPDIEMVLLCNELVATVGIQQWATHLGSRALYTLFFGWLPEQDPHLSHLLLRAIRERNLIELPALIQRAAKRAPYSSQECHHLIELFSYIGAVEQFPTPSIGPPAMRQAVERERAALQKIIQTLQECRPGAYVVDLSEVGTRPYHTGICFRLYIAGANRAVAAGGRYHIWPSANLSPREKSHSAVGFTLTLNTIEESLTDDLLEDSVAAATGESFTERYHNAHQRRHDGQRVHL